MAAVALKWCRLGLLSWLLLCWADAAQPQTIAMDATAHFVRRNAVQPPDLMSATVQGGPQAPPHTAVAAVAALQEAHARPHQQQRHLTAADSSGSTSASPGAVVYVGGGKGGSSGLYVAAAAPPPASQQQQSLREALANNSVGTIVVVGVVDMSTAWRDTQEEIAINRWGGQQPAQGTRPVASLGSIPATPQPQLSSIGCCQPGSSDEFERGVPGGCHDVVS
jgi:hypothetical protein